MQKFLLLFYPSQFPSLQLAARRNLNTHTRTHYSSSPPSKRPTPNHSPPNNPSRPPNPPNNHLRPNALRNPPLRQLNQHTRQPLIPIPPQAHSISSTHRAQSREKHVRQPSYGLGVRLADESERRGEQADDEREAEV